MLAAIPAPSVNQRSVMLLRRNDGSRSASWGRILRYAHTPIARRRSSSAIAPGARNLATMRSYDENSLPRLRQRHQRRHDPGGPGGRRGVDLEALNAAIGSLGLPGCRLRAAEVKKNGFRATQITVEYEPEHAHRHLHHILAMIDAGRLSRRARRTLPGGFSPAWPRPRRKVHGTTIEKVHFHEVGRRRFDRRHRRHGRRLGPAGRGPLVASPVPTGTGKIRIAHGECSVPAPATAELLRGIPLAESAIEGELTTPTGAAILATLADSFGPLPAMTIERIGYGAGQKDFAERPNILRLLVGEADEAAVGTRRPIKSACWKPTSTISAAN